MPKPLPWGEAMMTTGPDLEILTAHQESRTVVRLRGELDLSNHDNVRREIGMAVRRHDPQTLVLELSGLSFTDSTGLATMVWAHKLMAERGHQLLLADPHPLVRRLLRISGLDNHLEIVTENPAARDPSEADPDKADPEPDSTPAGAE
jgi:anti-anti-sigma factor